MLKLNTNYRKQGLDYKFEQVAVKDDTAKTLLRITIESNDEILGTHANDDSKETPKKLYVLKFYIELKNVGN